MSLAAKDLFRKMFCRDSSRSWKKTRKGKRPGKGVNRFWKSIGFGFKTPWEAIKAARAFVQW
ncbi:hypothetical protein JHK85_010814 [Glycine max]|nr:hypothetical protein JHK85_010814 [Glycine max]